jgi:hypothetical protein
MDKKLGRIDSVRIGFGGYQDAQLGISFTLAGKSWGVGDFWGYWASAPSENAKWTTEDQCKSLGETFLRIGSLLKDANCQDVKDLAGVPVEVTLDGNMLKSWRVLTEVIS